MDAGDWVAVYAAVVATIVALVQRRRERPPITLWFDVSAELELVVHPTNAGRRPLTIDVIGLSGPRWRPRGRLVVLPAPSGTPPVTTLEPGGSAQRTIARPMLWQQALEGRRWVYAGTALGTGRYRRIPTAVIRHVAHGPPRRGRLPGQGSRGGAPDA